MVSQKRLRSLGLWMGHLARCLLSLVVLAGGVAAYFAFGKAEPRRSASTEASVPLVEVAVVEPHEQGVPFSVDGVVVPFRQVGIAAEVSGRVAYKAEECRSGRTVRKGQLLLRIDPRDYQLEIRRLEKELAQAKAALVELAVQLENSSTQIGLAEEDLAIRQRELQRYVRVKDPGAVSGVEIDTARRNELAARNSLQTQRDQLRESESTRARLESARDLVQANLERARLDLERCEIVAPLDGIVVSDEVEQDGYVQQGTTVALLQDTSRVEVACKLYMSQMNWLWQANSQRAGADGNTRFFDFPETPVQVVYELGATSYAWDGVLQRYEGAGIDDQTRMAPCRVHVDQPLNARPLGQTATNHSFSPPTLMTGMFVEVHVRANPANPLLRIPQRALHPGNKTWVVRDGRLVETAARLAGREGAMAVIYSTPESPQPGDSVIVSPLAAPTAGQQVEIQEDV